MWYHPLIVWYLKGAPCARKGVLDMKAHIAALPPATALAWNGPAGGALEAVCAEAGVRLRRVEEKEIGSGLDG